MATAYVNYAVPSHHVSSDSFIQLQQSSLALWNLLLLMLPFLLERDAGAFEQLLKKEARKVSVYS